MPAPEHRNSGFPEGDLPTECPGFAGEHVAAALLAAVCVVGPTTAYADADYGVDSRAWNGLGDLVALGRGAGVTLDVPTRVDLDALHANDGLLLVYPTSELPRAALVAFLRRGGHVAIADDFGTGHVLLTAFDIRRAPPRPTAPDHRLRGNRNVVVATARTPHPLTRGVRALVANHPQALRHPSLAPLVAFGDSLDALVLVGAVGSGRLVAIGDASLLINNMLEFRDNRTFAENLLRYLGEHGRLVLASGGTEVTGSGGAATHEGAALDALRGGLERLARVPLPPAALTATTLGIVALLLFAAARALPRREPYLDAARVRTPRPAAGVAGRAAWYASPGRDLATPLADLERLLEAEVASRLALPRESSAARTLDALAALDRGTATQARALFAAFERARRERIDRRALRVLAETGSDLLAALDRVCSRTPP